MDSQPGVLMRPGAPLRAFAVCVLLILAVLLGQLLAVALQRTLGREYDLRVIAAIVAPTALILGFSLILVAVPAAVRFIRCGLHDLPGFVAAVVPGLIFLAVGAIGAALLLSREPPAKDGSRAAMSVYFGQSR